jgi:hypothetical protein
MIDVHELLRMKENEILRVRQEIRALHVVAPLLSEPDDAQVLEPNADAGIATATFEGDVAMENPAHDATRSESGDNVSESIPPKRSRLRNLLGMAAGE